MNKVRQNNPLIIIALDYDNETDALNLCNKLSPADCRLKIGKQLFTKYGPDIIEKIHNLGFEIFLDLKFHDIPTTVHKACLEAYKLGVWMGFGPQEDTQQFQFSDIFGNILTAFLTFDLTYLKNIAWPVFSPMLAGAVPTSIICWFGFYFISCTSISNWRFSRLRNSLN